jgi:hypothetical protein
MAAALAPSCWRAESPLDPVPERDDDDARDPEDEAQGAERGILSSESAPALVQDEEAQRPDEDPSGLVACAGARA